MTASIREASYPEVVKTCDITTAIEFGFIELVRALFMPSGRIDRYFEIAARYGRNEVIDFFLDHEPDIHWDADDALVMAATNGHTDTVRLLIDRGVDSNIEGVFQEAAINGYADTVRLLIDRGATILDKTLSYAVANGNTIVVKLLLDHGAHLEDNVLPLAVMSGQADLVKLLLDRGAHGMRAAGIETADQYGSLDMLQLLRDYSH